MRYATQQPSFSFHGVTLHYERQDLIESQLLEQYMIVKERLRENIATVFAQYNEPSVADAEALMVSGATILNSQEALVKVIIHEIK